MMASIYSFAFIGFWNQQLKIIQEQQQRLIYPKTRSLCPPLPGFTQTMGSIQKGCLNHFVLSRNYLMHRARWIDPDWVALNDSRGLQNEQHKLFMRYSGQWSADRVFLTRKRTMT